MNSPISSQELRLRHSDWYPVGTNGIAMAWTKERLGGLGKTFQPIRPTASR